jgi:hypothetical protein
MNINSYTYKIYRVFRDELFILKNQYLRGFVDNSFWNFYHVFLNIQFSSHKNFSHFDAQENKFESFSRISWELERVDRKTRKTLFFSNLKNK